MAVDVRKLDKWLGGDLEVAPERQDKSEAIRKAAMKLALAILDNTPPCSDQSAAIRRVREARFAAHEALRCGL